MSKYREPLPIPESDRLLWSFSAAKRMAPNGRGRRRRSARKSTDADQPGCGTQLALVTELRGAPPDRGRHTLRRCNLAEPLAESSCSCIKRADDIEPGV
jgi:hypothetical protein